MTEYNWDDIIVNPNSEEAKNCIGKKIYFSNNPTEGLARANRNDGYYLATLKVININSTYPFRFETEDSRNCAFECSCIILKKEKPKVYVPFSSVDEFLSTYFEKYESLKQGVNAHNEDILCKHGIWIKDKTTGYISMVVEFRENGVSRECGVLETINKDKSSYYPYTRVIKWANLLEDYTFLDNTPCGKLYLKEEKK